MMESGRMDAAWNGPRAQPTTLNPRTTPASGTYSLERDGRSFVFVYDFWYHVSVYVLRV